MSNKRAKLPSKLETELLARCRRRCCLCFFLDSKLDPQKIQIAHIDKNRSNNKIDNLVALCMNHHDEFDSTTRLSKGLTPSEVKLYKKKLEELIEKKDEQIELQFIGNEGKRHQHLMSGKLLGQIIEAYDREVEKIEGNVRPTGIELANIGISAIEEKGDFAVAAEAFMALIRLSVIAMQKGRDTLIEISNIPKATINYSALKLLKKALIDFSLFNGFMKDSRQIAFLGDKKFSDIKGLDEVLNWHFVVVSDIFYNACLDPIFLENNWAMDLILKNLAYMVVGYGYALNVVKGDLPETSPQVLLSSNGWRMIPDEDPDEKLPFIQLIYRLASLPPSLFTKIIEEVQFRLSFLISVTSSLDPLEDHFEKTKGILQRWGVLPGIAAILVGVKTEEDKKELEAMIKEIKEVGDKVTIAIKKLISHERGLIQDKKVAILEDTNFHGASVSKTHIYKDI